MLTFLEFLAQQNLTPKVIRNCMSSVITMAKVYHLQHVDTSHVLITRFLHSLSLNSTFAPTPRDIFDIPTLYRISLACVILQDPLLFRAVFLTAFYGFLRMSNIAPHRAKDFDFNRHFLRNDITFTEDGALLLIKWTKTLQYHNSYHILQLPKIKNLFLCPVKALRALLGSRPFPPSAPLFSTYGRSPNQILDTQVREALKKVLLYLNIHLQGHSFHAFWRSGATYVFDRNVSLQNIMSNGLWRSSAVWFYLQNASIAPSIVPQTFASSIPSHF